jgi:hypothetical protein
MAGGYLVNLLAEKHQLVLSGYASGSDRPGTFYFRRFSFCSKKLRDPHPLLFPSSRCNSVFLSH